MIHIRSHHVQSILSTISEPVDAHRIEFLLMKMFPDETTREIRRFLDNRYPIREFSRRFALWFSRVFGGRYRKTRRVATPNLGGGVSFNWEWAR